MKKITVIVLALLLALSMVSVLADQYPGTKPWEIYIIDSGTEADFDNDGTTEVFTFSPNVDEYGDGEFTLNIAGNSVTQENCCQLAGEVCIMYIGYPGYGWTDNDDYYATLFMVAEYGPSDDPYTYCYVYVDGSLTSAGEIPALPSNMSVDPVTGIITTRVRADMVGTWTRPADYMIARGYSWDDESFESYYHLTEVPRPVYPFGMIVSLKQELPLMASQSDRIFSETLEPGQQVILAATDDVRWLYVTSMDGSTTGWVRMSNVDYRQRITVGDIEVPIDDAFGDILYAD